MSQEWDYPPRRPWREEFVRPENGRRFERVVDHEPKPKTAWQWYKKQMRGGGTIIYKLTISALFFSGALLIYGAIALLSVAMVVAFLGRAQAAELTQHSIAQALNGQAAKLGYHLSFKLDRCSKDVNRVCDILVRSGPYHNKIMAVFKGANPAVDHFNFIISSGKGMATTMGAYTVLASIISDADLSLDTMMPFLTDEIQAAQNNGGTSSNPYAGIQQTVMITPAGALVTVAYQK